MKRQILTGLAVAGALTLWVGSSAFASEDPAETLLQQAEMYAAQASSAVTTCSETKIAALEATQAPTGVNSDAWETAVETATETVAGLAEQAQSSIDAALETFNENVETADEAGTTLPTLDSFKTEINAIADPTNGGNPACAGIEAVSIVTPTTSPADTETENDNSQGDSKAGDKAND